MADKNEFRPDPDSGGSRKTPIKTHGKKVLAIFAALVAVAIVVAVVTNG